MAIIAAIGGDTNHSEVLDVAHDLATTYEDLLIVVHVIPETETSEHLNEIRNLPEMGDYSIAQREEGAEQIAMRLTRDVLGDIQDLSFAGRTGRPDEEILATADEYDARFVVIGGKKRSPTGKAIFGSVTQSVLLNAHQPVVTVMDESSP